MTLERLSYNPRRYLFRKVMGGFFQSLTGLAALLILAVLALILGDILIHGAPQLSWTFLSDEPREGMMQGGIFPAIYGTAAMTLVPSGSTVCTRTSAPRYCTSRTVAGVETPEPAPVGVDDTTMRSGRTTYAPCVPISVRAVSPLTTFDVPTNPATNAVLGVS